MFWFCSLYNRYVLALYKDLYSGSILDDGDMYTFGSDYYGCLGCDNEEGDEVNTPILVEFFTGRPVEQVSCGESHIVALTKDNEVYSWGCGEFGKCT